ncbi:MAG: starch-binding protein [Ruminococcus sp.]|nr:starch-binding protein [Ruminococcus sp.]
MKLTKSFKKSISLMLSAILILSLFSAVAVSANAVSSGDVIYFEKPDSWSDNICIYYWEGSPKPSGLYDYKMENIGGNIYKYTAKASFNEFLFNDGDVSTKHQTVNVSLPSSGKMCRVLSTGHNNDWGNYCNDAEWVDFEQPSIGLAVSASPKNCDFVGSIEVTLSVAEAAYGTYKINGGTSVQYTDGTKLTLGADAQTGDVIKLDLSASADNESVSESYTYTKVSTPSASSLAYFDNSKYNWDDVYIYAYGTKENAKWPGEKMQADESGLYYYAFSSAFKNENVIFNNGKEKDEGKEQYPENSGLPLKAGECKLLTADNEWVDYGTPDSKPAGFAYTASGTAFSTDTMNVKIGLKNAVKGTYQIDDGSVFEYTGTTTVSVGQGKIGNSTVKLTLTAENDKGVKTSTDFTYKKTFTPTKTTYYSPSDGHTSDAVGGYYGTNPNMQLGKSKTITVDGNPSDWDSSMIIAQGVANDDPRVYMPSSMHEQPWDDYALYAAWDDTNLYFMWEMANTTYIVSPSDNFAASQEARPWRNSIPMYLALSVDPSIHADGTAWGTDKSGNPYTNPYAWGCDGGVAKDGGVGFKTNVDTLIAFDTNNSNGGASIFKADHYDEATDNYMFNYDTRIPIGVTSFEKQDNQNGFKIAHNYGTLSDTLFGVGGAKGSHSLGDSLSPNSNWVDFFDLGYQNNHGFIYEVAVPLSTLGIDKNYIETNGIGAMQILTYGTSGMDCLPYDASMQDNANVEYSYDPSTSHEKEDIDEITVPLARVGALLSDSVINEAPCEVNFGADKAGTQGVGTPITLKAEPYNFKSNNLTYRFTVNHQMVQESSSNTYTFTPTDKMTYSLGVMVLDENGKYAAGGTSITIGEEAPAVTEPTEPETYTQPTQSTETQATGTQPTQPTQNTQTTEPTETNTSGTQGTQPTEPTQASAETQSTNPTSETQTTEPTETQAPETTIKLKATKSTIYVGSTTTVKATVDYGVGSTTFKSSNTKVATVSSSGVVKGLKAGSVIITATNNGKSATVKINIVKKTNPMKVKASAKTVKYNTVKKKAVTVKAITVSKAQGTISYKKTSGKKFFTVNAKTGKITVKKGTNKGTYSIKVKVTAKGNTTYKPGTKTVTVKIKVK